MPGRSRFHRVLLLLCGATFALTSVAPGVVRPCPMHEAAAPEAPADHGHGAHHTPDDASPSPAQAPTHSCDCDTACCAAPSIAFLVVPPRVASSEVLETRSASHRTTLRRVAAREHALPFSIGPPRLTSG